MTRPINGSAKSCARNATTESAFGCLFLKGRIAGLPDCQIARLIDAEIGQGEQATVTTVIRSELF